MSNSPKQQTPVERWVQYTVQALSVAAVIGGFTLLSDLKTTIAVMSSEMRTLSAGLQELRRASEDRYTATQAAKDFGLVSKRYDDHERRLRRLEGKRNTSHD